ncbi:superoxide dismutase [Acuticoccus kandeliae]|uniref:superoxide dismutase n=1 Tax=Acuticoccus kandeliae TaxID=2073160 RepID=UPI000D3E76D7|nr:superoxide dismutase [Acuticoccus kandeliae]
MISRRTFFALSGATAAATLARPYIARAAAPFERPPLPFEPDALAPTISKRTVELHSGAHHQAYFDRLNRLVGGTDYTDMALEDVYVTALENGDVAIANNAGQAYNHILYFDQFAGGPREPVDYLAEALGRDYGGVEGVIDAMREAAGTVFGTGWVWLVGDGDALDIMAMEDAGNPLPTGTTPLLGIDLWEHAYYLDYENRMQEHLAAVLTNLVNWERVSERFA